MDLTGRDFRLCTKIILGHFETDLIVCVSTNYNFI